MYSFKIVTIREFSDFCRDNGGSASHLPGGNPLEWHHCAAVHVSAPADSNVPWMYSQEGGCYLVLAKRDDVWSVRAISVGENRASSVFCIPGGITDFHEAEIAFLEVLREHGFGSVPAVELAGPPAPTSLKLHRLARMDADTFREVCTFGFELETQRSEGYTPDDGNDEGEPEFDEERFCEAVDEAVNDCLGRDFGDLPGRLRAEIFEKLSEHFRETLDTEPFYEDVSSGVEPDDFKIRYDVQLKGIEVISDSSVSGYEFRTGRGGLALPAFVEHAERLFTLGHEIDTGCSFHVHVKVKDVKHVYSARAFREVVAYLLSRYDDLPEGVRVRLKNTGTRDRYFGFDVNQGAEKYSAVNWHHQGTIEFRLFGNVKDTANGSKCARIAADALRHLYRVSAGLEAALDVPSISDTEFTARCKRSCDEGCALNLHAPSETVLAPLCLDEAA